MKCGCRMRLHRVCKGPARALQHFGVEQSRFSGKTPEETKMGIFTAQSYLETPSSTYSARSPIVFLSGLGGVRAGRLSGLPF